MVQIIWKNTWNAYMKFENVEEKMSNEIPMKLIRRLQKCFEIDAIVRLFAECKRFSVIVIKWLYTFRKIIV